MFRRTILIPAMLAMALALVGCKSTSNWMQSFQGMNSDTGNLDPQVGQYNQPSTAPLAPPAQ